MPRDDPAAIAHVGDVRRVVVRAALLVVQRTAGARCTSASSGRRYIEVVWTLPAPVGAYLSSGGDVKALALQLINLAIAVGIWWPFVRRYDKELASSEARPVVAAST